MKKLNLIRPIAGDPPLALAPILLLVFVVPPAIFQSNTGAIVGTATDASGGAIPGAAVTAKNLGTGAARTATTGGDGEVVISNSQVGHYSVTVTHEGFATAEIADTEVQVGQRKTINPVLQVGSVSAEVTVIANETPLLNQASSSADQLLWALQP